MYEEEIQVDIAPVINYDRTIAKGRLIYKKNAWFILKTILYSSFFILLTVFLFVFGFGFDGGPQDNGYCFLIIGIIAATWLVAGFVLLNRLIKVKGKNILRNKEDVMATLNCFYEGLTFDASKENIIRDIKPSQLLSGGRVLTVILYDDTVYFHKCTLMRGNVISPITALFDYLKCKEMAEYFLELQAKAEA